MASKKLQGITIEIDGNTSGLQDSLKGVNGSLYNVQNELKQVDKLLKLDPQNVDLLAQKENLLSDAINSTTDKLKTLKIAKEQADEKFASGEMSEEQFRELEREIISTEQSLNKLNNEFDATNNTTNKIDLKGFASKMGDIGKVAGDVVLKVTELTTKLAAGLAGAISATAAKMVSMAKESGKFADDLITLSNQTNVSTDTLQKWDYAARFIDTDVSTMTGAMSKMTKSLDTNKDAYKSLGVSLTDTSGKLRSQEDIFMDTIDALGKIKNDTERDATAMKLFGKSAQELNPLIKAGGAELKRLGEEAENAGLVVGGDVLNQFGSFDDMMQRMDAKFTGLKNNITASFMPAISGMVAPIEESIGSISNILADGFQEEDMSKISDIISSLADNIGSQLNENIPKILEFVVQALNSLVGMIVEVLPTLLPILVEGVFSILNALISSILTNIEPIMNMVTTLLTNVVNFIVQNLPLILEAGVKILIALIEGIADAIPQLLPAIVQVIQEIITIIIQNLPQIIMAGIDILVGLIEGITNAIPILVDMIPTIIENIISTLIANLPLILEAGVKILIALIEGIIKTIPSLILQAPKIIAAIVKGLIGGLSSIADVGKNVVEGLWNGIKNSFDWIKNKIKSWIGNVLDFIKKLFGIHSPSTVMRDQIGENLGKGMAEGILDSAVDVEKAMKGLSSKVETSVNPVINPTANSNPLIIQIENFNNTRETDIQSLAEELEFYRKNSSLAKGGK